MRKLLPLTVIALLAASSLVACSGTSESDPTANVAQSTEPQSQKQEEPGDPAEAGIKEYFDKLATGEPKDAEEAAKLAAPDSNAYAYAKYIAATDQAASDRALAPETSTVNKVDGGFKVCADTLNVSDPCAEYTNIQEVDGKIANFDTDGEPLTGRVSLGDGKAQPLADLGEATMVASFKSSGGIILTVFDVRSKADGLQLSATYAAPDGTESESIIPEAANQMAEGASASHLLFMFDSPNYGGNVLLKPYTDSSKDAPATTFAVQ